MTTCAAILYRTWRQDSRDDTDHDHEGESAEKQDEDDCADHGNQLDSATPVPTTGILVGAFDETVIGLLARRFEFCEGSFFCKRVKIIPYLLLHQARI